MKVYLSGPMSRVKDFNFPAFSEAARLLRDDGHEVFSPAEEDTAKYGDIFRSETGDPIEVQVHGFSLRDALYKDTEWICLNADAIAMLPGWERSNGAQAEWALARALGLRIIYL